MGGHPDVPEVVKAALERAHPGVEIVGMLSPPFGPLSDQEEEAMLAAINAAAPDIVWVALGSPRQEKWMAEHQEALNAKVLIGVGAAFDFISGRKPHAPRWVQRSGLEWLFRLASEPGRLWGRYLRYPQFAVLLAAQLLGFKHYTLMTVDEPGSGSDGSPHSQGDVEGKPDMPQT
jgi:N-acetylglucosaminyldiphosphoundecaprenol N-acetyl-beta-D-mannosaminyltransferase